MITQGFREGTSRFSATERPRLFPRVSLGSFLIARVHKIVELGQNEQKSSLFCLSRCLASGPKVSLTLWVNDPLKLAPQPPVFVFVFVCVYLNLYSCICICICVFVFVFDHDYLFFWFIFDENPFLRLSLTSHDNSGVSWGNQPFLGDGTSETLSEGIPGQLFDSPCPQNCWIGPKRTKKFALLS